MRLDCLGKKCFPKSNAKINHPSKMLKYIGWSTIFNWDLNDYLQLKLNCDHNNCAALRPSHTTTETTKKVVIVHTHYNFFSQLQRFFNSFIYDNDFPTDFFRKIFVKIFVVCKGLYNLKFLSLHWSATWFQSNALLVIFKKPVSKD